MTEKDKLKIQELEMREDLGALMIKDVVNSKDPDSNKVVPALFYFPKGDVIYTFYTRGGGKSINQIRTTQDNTFVPRGILTFIGYEKRKIWPHDSDYSFINNAMEEAGL
jgi:hypothetical protein